MLPWWPDVDCCIGGLSLSLRVWWLGCVIPFGCGSIVRARPRDDGYSRAAENVRLMWNPPPCPDSSSLHDWFLGGGCAGSQCPPSVPFFPEVHEQFTSSWKTPFTARNKSWSSSPLTTLDGGAALGYTGVPSVERTVAMQLCPTAATALRGEPCLPLRTCLYSSGLTSSAYRACGEAASALSPPEMFNQSRAVLPAAKVGA